MSFADDLAADRRLVVLRALSESPAGSCNEGVARLALAHVGHRVAADVVRAELQFLADHDLIRIEQLPTGRGGDLWVATITRGGLDVAEGLRRHPGVARPRPE